MGSAIASHDIVTTGLSNGLVEIIIHNNYGYFCATHNYILVGCFHGFISGTSEINPCGM